MKSTLKLLEEIKSSLLNKKESCIDKQIAMLQTLAVDAELKLILSFLSNNEFDHALLNIDTYLAKSSGLVIFKDPKVDRLKEELKALESELEKLSDLKGACEIEIDNFNHAYQLNLGEIIKDILKLREDILSAQVETKKQVVSDKNNECDKLKKEVESFQHEIRIIEIDLDTLDEWSNEYKYLYGRLQYFKEKLKTHEQLLQEALKDSKAAEKEFSSDPLNQAFEDAQADSSSFGDDYSERLAKNIKVLDKSELKELKTLYRKACKLCHPDTVAENLKEKAHKIMTELNHAKDQHSIKQVRSILQKLELGGVFESISDTLSNFDELTAKVDEIRDVIIAADQELSEISRSETYQEIININDQYTYFERLKIKFSMERFQLQSTLHELNTEQHF